MSFIVFSYTNCMSICIYIEQIIYITLYLLYYSIQILFNTNKINVFHLIMLTY